MAGGLLPQPKQLIQDNAWNPGIAFQIYTYDAGSLTPKATYQDGALTIANTNPVIANGRGEVVMYGTGTYRVILKDSLGNTIWDRDGVDVLVSSAALQASIDQYKTQSGHFFYEDGAKISRAADRLFVGGSVIADGKNSRTSNGWLETLRNFSVSIAQLAVTSTIGQIGIAAGSRTSECPNAGAMGCIGVESIVNNDNASQLQYAFGGYFESRRQANAGTTHGIEIDIVNLGDVPVCYPGAVNATNLTSGLWLASGGEVTGATTASVALCVKNNGADFDKGIIFESNSVRPFSGEAVAIAMAPTQGLVWYDSADHKLARIRSDATTASLGIVFSNGQLNFQKADTTQIAVLTANNVFQFQGAGTYSATGTLTLNTPLLNLSALTTSTTASSGANAVPTTCAKFVTIQVDGSSYKLPVYNV